jgi:hypothetical protein
MKEYIQVTKDVTDMDGNFAAAGEKGELLVYHGKTDRYIIRIPPNDINSNRGISLFRYDFKFINEEEL